MSVKSRQHKVKAAKHFATKINTGNKNDVWLVPGSNGKQYNVRIRRDGILSTQCWRVDGIDCPGNSNGHVCYHSMAALELEAESKGMQIAWTDSKSKAQRLSRLGGQVFRVKSHHGTGVVWGVAKEIERIEE